MSDGFDDLKQAFHAATPAPDEARRRANLLAAEETFAARQGNAGDARLTPEAGNRFRLLTGVKKMMTAMTTRGGLAATTALVAFGVVAVSPMGRDLWSPPGPVDFEPRLEVPAPLVREEAVANEKAAVASEPELQEALPTPRAARPDVGLSGQMASEPISDMDAVAAPETRQQFSAAPDAKRVVLPAPGPTDTLVVPSEGNEEVYANAESAPLKVTLEEPVSTFSIDVDTASYAIVRSSLERGTLPPRDAVRIEEMVNYFPYDYVAPDGDAPFETTISVLPTPWNTGTQLVHIGLQGTLPAVEDRPPLNLVFLIDTSGSMQDANKLPLLKQSLRMMLPELGPQDEVAIVTYAGSAGEVLEPTSAVERGTIERALEALEAGGSTAGAAGIELAYSLADRMAADGEIGRVILATDGDFNVGISDPEALADLIAEKRDDGTYLSVLGFGRGNLDDATMQALAQNGNGQAAYIDTLSEARKVLVDQLTGALFPIANDVKIQVEFNPAEIAEYRLIGYETRALAREDFNNDRVDAGDIGAGHSVTALYEVTPVGSDAILNGPLRYGASAPAEGNGELGYFRLRYKLPGESNSRLIEAPIAGGGDSVSDDVRFAVAIAGFGQLLRGSDYLLGWDWTDAIDLGVSARGPDPFGYRAEAIDLMRLAEALSR